MKACGTANLSPGPSQFERNRTAKAEADGGDAVRIDFRLFPQYAKRAVDSFPSDGAGASIAGECCRRCSVAGGYSIAVHVYGESHVA